MDAADGAGAAGALGAAAGVLLGSLEAAAAGFAASPDAFAAAGFADEYRSLYHPPPEKCTAGAFSVRSSAPPQCGHAVSSGSENFWIFSVRRPHCWHWYS